MLTNHKGVIMEETKSSRLQYFPVMIFAIIMGLGGLTLDYKKATEVLSFPPILFQFLCVIVSTLSLIIFCFYILKLLKYPQAILSEFTHPVKLNFFATISMSALLLSNIFHNITPLSHTLFSLAAGFQIFIALYAITYWLNKDIEFAHSNPA